MSKKEIYDLIVENKYRLFCRHGVDKDLTICKFLEDRNIILPIDNITLYNVISYLNDVDTKCKMCDNKRRFEGIRISDRYEHGFLKTCSIECENKLRSELQIGSNNTFHRISNETLDRIRIDSSTRMKNKINSGEFTPNITNSWCRSKIRLNIDGNEFAYRSSWEAFFHICNKHLQYEKLRILYEYNGNKHNYIVDFIDVENRIIYEVKPDSCLDTEKNTIKRESDISWSEKNGYEYVIIGDNWFKLNLPQNKYLLDNQIDGHLISKRLKQFEKK